MTTTIPTLGHRRSVSNRGFAQSVDLAVAQIGITLLRWANDRSRRSTLSHEAHSTLRTIESARAARELDAQRLTSMRGF